MFCSLTRYYSCVEIKEMRWAGNVARVREIRGPQGILVGNTEGNDTTW